MSDLVERYVHQVGRYLPPKERAEIEAELRSQIQDQLDDRYDGSTSEADIAAVLSEFGYPYQMAASYNSEQYLVGPDLYPIMMIVLRHGWLLVPAIVLFLNIFGAVISSQQRTLFDLFIETIIAVVQAALIFSAVVVLIFAIIQRLPFEFDEKEKPFSPLELPKVDDPRTVDRAEAAFGVAFGTFVVLVLFYFLQVGGLTLRFNLSDPGEVTPVSAIWMILLIIVSTAMVILHLLILRRNRWGVGLWLLQTILEAIGVICLYFVLYKPFFEFLLTTVPSLANLPFIGSAAEIIAVGTAVSTLLTKGSKLVTLWNYQNSGTVPFTAPANK